MPLPNSRLLHPRFHENLRRSAVGDAGMPDHGTFTRPSAGAGTTDASGDWNPAAGTTVCTVDLRVQADSTQDRTVIVGDKVVTLHAYKASIPWDAPQVLVDDVLVLDRSADPLLAGRPLIVRDVTYDTFQVRRYLQLEDHPEHLTPGG